MDRGPRRGRHRRPRSGAARAAGRRWPRTTPLGTRLHHSEPPPSPPPRTHCRCSSSSSCRGVCPISSSGLGVDISSTKRGGNGRERVRRDDDKTIALVHPCGSLTGGHLASSGTATSGEREWVRISQDAPVSATG